MLKDHILILSIGLEVACNGGYCGGMSFGFEKVPSISLHWKLVPVQCVHRDYEYGLDRIGYFAQRRETSSDTILT